MWHVSWSLGFATWLPWGFFRIESVTVHWNDHKGDYDGTAGIKHKETKIVWDVIMSYLNRLSDMWMICKTTICFSSISPWTYIMDPLADPIFQIRFEGTTLWTPTSSIIPLEKIARAKPYNTNLRYLWPSERDPQRLGIASAASSYWLPSVRQSCTTFAAEDRALSHQGPCGKTLS